MSNTCPVGVLVSLLCQADTASIDLDVVACAFNKDGQFMECVYFNNLRAADGALLHTGASFLVLAQRLVPTWISGAQGTRRRAGARRWLWTLSRSLNPHGLHTSPIT